MFLAERIGWLEFQLGGTGLEAHYTKICRRPRRKREGAGGGQIIAMPPFTCSVWPVT